MRIEAPQWCAYGTVAILRSVSLRGFGEYAYGQPYLTTRRKNGRLELAAGVPHQGIWDAKKRSAAAPRASRPRRRR